MRFFVRAVSLVSVSSALCLVLAACGSSSSGGNGGNSGAGGSDGGATVNITCNGPSQLDLTGTWAVYIHHVVNLESQAGGAIAVCPVGQVSDDELYMLLNISGQSGTTISTVNSVSCGMTLPQVTAIAGECPADDPNPLNLVHSTIGVPDAMNAALAKVKVAPVSATLSAAGAGATVSFQKIVVTLGSTVPDPNMPVWNQTATGCSIVDIGNTTKCETACVSDCSELVDADGDGYPGVTAQLCGMTNQDIAQRNICDPTDPPNGSAALSGLAFMDFEVDPVLTGTVKSSCEVSGTLADNVVYNIVGANVYLEGAAVSVNSALGSLPPFTVDPVKSTFHMVRVDGQYGAPNWNVDMTNATAAACATTLSNINQIK